MSYAFGAEVEPVNVSTRLMTFDQLSGWDLPKTELIKFDGSLPIKDSAGSEVKGRFDESTIYVTNAFIGLKKFQAGDKWGVDTKFADGSTGRYTYLIEKHGGGLGVRCYSARTGNFKGTEFALVDVNSNGLFNEAGADLLIWNKKQALKVGDAIKIGEDEYSAKVSEGGATVVFGKGGMGFGAATSATGGGGIDDGLAVWNAIRESIGVPPVKRDPQLEEWGYKHIEYMKAIGQLVHPEDKNHPKFTPEGHKAGNNSCLGRGRGDPKAAIMGQLTCFLHRIPLIAPELELTSFCVDPEGWSAFDHGSGKRRSFTWKGPIAYPPDGASDFGPYWSGNEGPCPIPGGPPQGGVGQPVTLTFPRGAKITDAKMTLTDASGKEVDGWVSTPEQPAVSMFRDNMRTCCFIAKQPLAAETTYTAKVTCKENGRDFEKTWSFKTSKSNVPGWVRGGGRGGGRGR